MKAYVKALNNLPKIVKFILALPFLDILWGIYRICKSGAKKHTIGVILGILCIFPGAAFIWILDIITILLSNKVLWID